MLLIIVRAHKVIAAPESSPVARQGNLRVAENLLVADAEVLLRFGAEIELDLHSWEYLSLSPKITYSAKPSVR